jgi:hypothetical protein
LCYSPRAGPHAAAGYQVPELQRPLPGAVCAKLQVRVSTPLFSASVNTSPVATTLEVSV